MSFQAYIDNIKAKTGKSPAEFRELANGKGWMSDGRLRAEIKAGEVVTWLKEEFGLGYGHSMAIVAVLKGAKNEGSK